MGLRRNKWKLTLFLNKINILLRNKNNHILLQRIVMKPTQKMKSMKMSRKKITTMKISYVT